MPPEFDKYSDSEITKVAEILIEYGLPTADAIKSVKDRIRDFTTETIRPANITPEWIHTRDLRNPTTDRQTK